MERHLAWTKHWSRRFAVSLAIATGLIPASAQAASFELIYNGVFNTQNALNPASQTTPAYFAAPTPFTIVAIFDTSSPNFAPASPPAPPPFAGFRAYAPSTASINIGGVDYSIETITQNPTAGITVAIFDQASFTPGFYAVGILQQPPQDGAGIIGDFSGASPGFTANTIAATVFTGYNGVGYGSGVCLQGTGGACSLNAVTPLILHNANNQTFALTLGNFAESYPVARPGTADLTGPLNSAQIVALPEPAAFTLLGLGLAGLVAFARPRRSAV